MPFLTFMSSPIGRAVRIIAGVVLVIAGIALGGGFLALALVGLVPLAAGIFDVCLFASLAKQPFGGKAFRTANHPR